MKYMHWFSSLVCAATLASPACAAGKQPLLQEGKHALFQRVLTYPGCQLSAKAGEASLSMTSKWLPPSSEMRVMSGRCTSVL